MTRRLAVAVASLIVAAVALPSPAAAQEKDEAFKQGLEARKDKQWAAVVTEMRRAIQEDAKESPRKVGGIFRSTEYLPYYFLGEAYFNQQDCANAVIEWENSLKHGVVRTRPEFYAFLQKGNAACEARGILLAGKYEAAVERARLQVDSAYAVMTRLKDKGNANLGIWRQQPNFEAQYQRASNEYDSARKQLAQAQRTRLDKDFTEVVRIADHVKEMVGTLDGELTALVTRAAGLRNVAEEIRRNIAEAEKLDAEIEPNASFLDPSMKALRADGQKALENARQQVDPRRLSDSSVAAARASLVEGTDSLQKVLAAVRAVIATGTRKRLEQLTGLATAAFSKVETELQTVQSLADRYPAQATPQLVEGVATTQKQLVSVKRRHDNAVRSQQAAAVEAAIREAEALYARLLELGALINVPPAERVPSWVRDGAGRYLAGDYAGAIDKLNEGTASGDTLVHVHLFRAAAHYALFVRSGQKDTARHDQAVAEVGRCKALSANLAPDRRAFSPAFIDFFNKAGSVGQSAARTQ